MVISPDLFTHQYILASHVCHTFATRPQFILYHIGVWRFNILAIFHLVTFPFLPYALDLLFQGPQDGIFGRVAIITGCSNNCQSDESRQQ